MTIVSTRRGITGRLTGHIFCYFLFYVAAVAIAAGRGLFFANVFNDGIHRVHNRQRHNNGARVGDVCHRSEFNFGYDVYIFRIARSAREDKNNDGQESYHLPQTNFAYESFHAVLRLISVCKCIQFY